MNTPTARQIIAARALLGISQSELAADSRIAVSTIRRFEASAGRSDEPPSMRLSTMVSLVRYFNDRGIEFRDEQDSFGVMIARKLTP